jgi:glycosyltransferase involved in cell wall biosynthesis
MTAVSDPGKAPRVSVVVPTYNRAPDIARCLDSLVAQSYRDFEVLVCDDGSKDDTREVVESFTDRLHIEYHWAENWGGPARPRNVGLAKARGEYLAFLDSDDWWMPEKLARSVAALDAGADVVYHDLFFVDKVGQRNFGRRQRTATLRAPVFEQLLRMGNVIANSSVVLRTDLLRDIGGLSEERALIACEDFDAWLRLARRTDRFVRVDGCLGFYWLGGGNISSAQRTLVNLARLDELYLRQRTTRRRPAWYHYMLGFAYYELEDQPQALGHLVRALFSGLPPARFVKAAVRTAIAAGRLLLGARAVRPQSR